MNKISLREKMGYGVGAVGLDLSYGLFYSYLALYLQTGLGISPWFMLILAPLARLWDGINDPMMGTLVDNSHHKMGKFRPWIIRGAVLNAIVLFLLFNNPVPRDSVWIYVYVAAFYVLWGMTNTLADIPYWSMIPSFSSEEKDRNLISTIARSFSGIGQGIISILTPIVVVLLAGSQGKMDEASPDVLRVGFGRWAAIASVFLVVFAFVSVVSTKERRVIPGGDKFSFKAALNVIKQNDQLQVFMLFAMISNAGYYMTSGISAFYFREVIGDFSKQSTFNLFGAVGSILGLLVIPVCSKFMNNRSTYKVSLSMAAAGYIGMAIIGYGFGGQVVGLGLCYLLTSMGIGSMFVNQTVMLADVVDYGEFKIGTRNQSLTFSMKGFLQKMAYTVQSIIMYASFGATKFSGMEGSVASVQAKSAISVLMLIVPPVLILLSLLIFSKKYKIYGDFKQEVLNAVNAKIEAESKQ